MIKQEFDKMKPAIAAGFIQRVEAAAKALTEADAWHKARDYRHTMHDAHRTAGTFAEFEQYVRDGKFLGLRRDYLNKRAVQFADEQVDGFAAKTLKKLGELDEMKINELSANYGTFEIVGARNGHAVRVEQKQTHNYSVNGNFYLQFPARIYVDGKFTPASKFNEATAK